MENVLEILKTIGMWLLVIVGISIILAYIGIEISISLGCLWRTPNWWNTYVGIAVDGGTNYEKD